jgi:hypothetical protein
MQAIKKRSPRLYLYVLSANFGHILFARSRTHKRIFVVVEIWMEVEKIWINSTLVLKGYFWFFLQQKGLFRVWYASDGFLP